MRGLKFHAQYYRWNTTTKMVLKIEKSIMKAEPEACYQYHYDRTLTGGTRTYKTLDKIVWPDLFELCVTYNKTNLAIKVEESTVFSTTIDRKFI